MMPVSITYLNQVNMATAWLRVRGLAIFFKQKTAYEIMSGDWSSDVCSSDLYDMCE